MTVPINRTDLFLGRAINVTGGGFYTLFLLGSGIKVYEGIQKFIHSSSPEESSRAKNELLLKVVNSASALSLGLEWGASAKWINLGAFLPLIQAASFTSVLIHSVARLAMTCRDLVDGSKNPTKSWLNVAIHATSIAWSILGISSILVGHLVLPVISTAFFLASCIFVGISFIYENQEKPQPAAATSS